MISHGDGGEDHEERVVEEEAVLAEVLGVQLLLHVNALAGRAEIVQEDKDVALRTDKNAQQ